jgi:branched-chain amino acid transport system substrate-binding protein
MKAHSGPRSQTPVWERTAAKLRFDAGTKRSFVEKGSQTGVWEPGKNRAFSLARCLAVSLSILTAGCAGRPTPAPIMIGHVATLSGPDKQAGEAAARGIRLAVEEINKDLDKGVGRPFAVIHSNARGSDAFEAEGVRVVAINRVWAMLGGTSRDEVERLDRARAPLLTPLGTKVRNVSDGVFYTGLAPEQHGKVLAQFAVLELTIPRLIIVHDERHEESVEIADAVAREFVAAWAKKDAKAEPSVRRLRLSKAIKTTDQAEALQELIKVDGEGPRAVVFAGKVDDLRELGPVAVPLLYAGEPDSAPALTALHKTNQVMYYVTPFVRDADAPRTVDFAARFRKAFSEDPDVHAALAYEGMKLLSEAMLRVKDNLTMPRLREELAKLGEVNGLAGPLSFTAERQLRRTAFVIRIDDGGAKCAMRYGPEN